MDVKWHWYLTQSDPPSTVEVTNSPRHTVSSVDGTLTITGVFNVDIGWYKCQVISKGGNDSSSAFLQVTGGSIIHLLNSNKLIFSEHIYKSSDNDVMYCQIGEHLLLITFWYFSELPHKPVVTSVVQNPSDLRSINVSWSPGFDGNSPIIRFILQYRKVDYIPDKGFNLFYRNIFSKMNKSRKSISN